MTSQHAHEQYKDASNLDARIALHTRFNRNSVAWFPWVLDRLTLPEGARVLELGCGPAKLWRENLERIPNLGRNAYGRFAGYGSGG